MVKRQFIVEPCGGLANRLRALLSAQRLANLTDRQLALVWKPQKGCGCKFGDLFEPVATEVNASTPGSASSPETTEISINETFKLYTQIPVIYCRTLNLITAPGERPRTVHLSIAPYFNRLKPITCIQAAVDACVTKQFRPHMLGVHVRRGRHRVHKKLMESGQIEAVDAMFFSEVDRYLRAWPEAGVFLATDDGAPTEFHEKYNYRPEGLVRKFTERYGSKLVTYNKRTLDRADVTGVQDALIDLLLLNHTNFVLGSAGSSFSKFAIMRNLESLKDPEKSLKMVGIHERKRKRRPLIRRVIVCFKGLLKQIRNAVR